MIPKANAVASDFSARTRDAALDMPVALPVARVTSHSSAVSPGYAVPGSFGLPTFAGIAASRLRGWVAGLRDEALGLAIGVVLFASTAWLLALTEVPPMQDLPNHLAAITIIQHPAAYPEFVFNGFFKTNAALFSFLCVATKVVGLKTAARLFTLLVLAVTSAALPQFVLEMTRSRRKMIVASFFMWPMIHNWFVSMGMLDFALGVPLSLAVLTVLSRHLRAPSWKLATLAGALAVATWYAHVFALMMAMMLLGIHILTRRTWQERFASARLLVVPLIPGGALVMMSLYSHLTEPAGAMVGFIEVSHKIPSWELAYNMWAEYLWGFTALSASSLVVVVGLFLIAVVRRRESPTFFSPVALLSMIVLYLALPYVATNWFHVNSRVIPFLWMAMLLRVPERLPRVVLGGLVFSAVLYLAGMGVDYVRLEGDRQKFVAGMNAVPEHAHLLPLLFKRQLTSENTRSLLHAWGYYVIEKETDAPLLFAHSRSFPVMYREPPPARFNHLVLEKFAPTMASPAWMCDTLRAGGVVTDCITLWRDAWEDFWREAVPAYDHVLMWDPPAEVMALIPQAYRVSFRQDRLVILERIDGHVAQLTAAEIEAALSAR